jgi:hypothetical protein
VKLESNKDYVYCGFSIYEAVAIERWAACEFGIRAAAGIVAALADWTSLMLCSKSQTKRHQARKRSSMGTVTNPLSTAYVPYRGIAVKCNGLS